MKISERKSTLRHRLLWLGVLSLLGIAILTALSLTDRSEKSVVQPDTSSRPAPEKQDPDQYLDPVSIEPIVPSSDPERVDSSPALSGIVKDDEEGLSRGAASASGSLYTIYGDVVANETIRLFSESAN